MDKQDTRTMERNLLMRIPTALFREDSARVNQVVDEGSAEKVN